MVSPMTRSEPNYLNEHPFFDIPKDLTDRGKPYPLHIPHTLQSGPKLKRPWSNSCKKLTASIIRASGIVVPSP
jgi:hypothetical protein